MDKEKKRKIILQNHWSKQSEEKRKETKKKISETMIKYHRIRLTKLPSKKHEQKIINSPSNILR